MTEIRQKRQEVRQQELKEASIFIYENIKFSTDMTPLLNFVFSEDYAMLTPIRLLILTYWMPQRVLPYLAEWATNPLYSHPRSYFGTLPPLVPYFTKNIDGILKTPIFYNSTFGGYNIPVDFQSLLDACGVGDMIGLEKREDGGHNYDYEDDLSRHNLFLYIAFDMWGFNESKPNYSFAVQYIPSSCIDVYTINSYDGAETVFSNAGEAVRNCSKKFLTAESNEEIIEISRQIAKILRNVECEKAPT